MLNKDKPVELIFTEDCTNCGICAQNCHSDYLKFEENKIKINPDAPFGCIQCGHCMMSCPQNAIKVRGEGITENDVFNLNNNYPDYDGLYSLLAKRRSARNFKKQEVPREIINKILEAGATGAISIPPYEVKILIVNGFDKVQELANDIISSLAQVTKKMNPFIMKLIMGKEKFKVFSDFVFPLVEIYKKAWAKGENWLFYNAPTVILFYSSKIVENEDAIIASTLAQTAAESLGLGTCIIGGVPPAINYNKKLKQKYGIADNEQVSTAFILGYPEKKFLKGIKRRFKDIKSF